MIGRNNPLNIRYNVLNKWKGQLGYNRGFCSFRDVKFCIRAGFKILLNYTNRGIVTYSQMITAWAPAVENPTKNYINYVCDKCKVFPFDKPDHIEDYAVLIYYMWCFEQGKSPSLSIADIEKILNDFDFINS